MQNENKKDLPPKKKFSLFRKKTKNIFEEELVQSPGRTVIRNFFSNKLAMVAFVIFMMIFLTVLVAPFFYKIDLSYQESNQINIAAGLDMLDVPKGMKHNPRDIAIGSSFTVGVDEHGKIYEWGKPNVTGLSMKVPEEYKNKKFRLVAAGYDHVIGITEDGELLGWGNNRLGQLDFPKEIDDKETIKKIVDITAGYQYTLAVDSDGYVYGWGNKNLFDYKKRNKLQGKAKQVVMTTDGAVGLSTDGKVVYLGRQKTNASDIPKNLPKIKELAATAATVAALTEDGKVIFWGSFGKYNENAIPKNVGKIKEISGGRYHYAAVTEDGHVIAWGGNAVGQIDMPSSLKKEKAASVVSGFYQNYVKLENGNIVPFGCKGYLFGTDELGRDIFTRILIGGRMTMTIGAVAVIISTIIGIIIGGISGYFGGKTDMLLQRITELVSSLPFLPFAMILTAMIGNRMGQNERILLIMVILGLLSWTGLSRLVRAQVLAEREKEFVTAARSIGVKELAIVFKHILPNVISVIIVTATLSFATCMLTESTLSYLGFGVIPPQPTWGNMLNGANDSIIIRTYPWRWVYASIILGICTICINMIGDGLRDAIDPKSNER